MGAQYGTMASGKRWHRARRLKSWHGHGDQSDRLGGGKGISKRMETTGYFGRGSDNDRGSDTDSGTMSQLADNPRHRRPWLDQLGTLSPACEGTVLGSF